VTEDWLPDWLLPPRTKAQKEAWDRYWGATEPHWPEHLPRCKACCCPGASILHTCSTTDGTLRCSVCGRPERDWRWTCHAAMWLLVRWQFLRYPSRYRPAALNSKHGEAVLPASACPPPSVEALEAERDDANGWLWWRSPEVAAAIEAAVTALQAPPLGGYERKELRGIVSNAVMRSLNAAGVALPNYRVPPDWKVEALAGVPGGGHGSGQDNLGTTAGAVVSGEGGEA
jgi:hypothetical protein